MADFTDPEHRSHPSATGGTAHQPFEHRQARPTVGGHPHGKPASWVLIGTVIVAFLAGGAALIVHLWWLFWLCVAVVVLAIPAGKAIRIMDDTVVWGSTAGHDPPQLPGRADEHARAQGGSAPEE